MPLCRNAEECNGKSKSPMRGTLLSLAPRKDEPVASLHLTALCMAESDPKVFAFPCWVSVYTGSLVVGHLLLVLLVRGFQERFPGWFQGVGPTDCLHTLVVNAINHISLDKEYFCSF